MSTSVSQICTTPPTSRSKRMEDEESRKRRVLKRLRIKERVQYEKWPIRSHYLSWTPMEVDEVKDRSLLKTLYNKYAFPSSPPRNAKEEAFLDIMKETILFRLMTLHLDP